MTDNKFKTNVNNFFHIKTTSQFASAEAVDVTKKEYEDIYNRLDDLENFDNSTIEIISEVKSDLNNLSDTLNNNQSITVEELESINQQLSVIKRKLELAVKTLSSENFLINSDFQINQRGSTSYAVTSAKTYTVDRWFSDYSGTTITTSDSGITLTASESNICSLSQIIENNLNGYTMCFSIKTDGNIYSVSTEIINDCVEQFRFNKGYIELSKKLCSDNKQHIVVKIVCNAGEVLTVNYAKLEIGSTPTLYTPPVYADELVRCKRFYLSLEDLSINVYTNAGGYVYGYFTIPTIMRTVSIKKYSYGNDSLFFGKGSYVYINHSTSVYLVGQIANDFVKTYEGSSFTIKSEDAYCLSNEVWILNLAKEGASVKLIAYWKPIEFTVQFENCDQSEFPNQTLKYYDSLIITSNPQKTGYVFDGWQITGMDNNEHWFVVGENETEFINGESFKTTKKYIEFAYLTTVNNSVVTFTACWKEV